MRIKYLALVLLTGFASVEAAAQSAAPTQTEPQATQIKGLPSGAVVGSAYRKPVQSAPPRKDIPTIAKAANGSIVSVVMSDKDGKPIAQGSGFLVSRDGLIVTNYHVILEGSSAIAKFPDGAFFVVDGVVAFDKTRDVAVIQAHGKNFRTLTLGNSDRVRVGEEVVAIGNPLSLESTVSNGIVSGIRTVKEEGGTFLQVTAPISPGSSGGPLFNMAGEVVGITTLYLKGGENLNFAIPINDAKRLLLNRSGGLRKLPDGMESEATEPKKEETCIYSDIETPPRFHVVANDPNTGIILVRQGKKLFTATVVEALVCDYGKELKDFDAAKDCKGTSSIAGRFVGQDIPSELELTTSCGKVQGYCMNAIIGDAGMFGRNVIHLEEIRSGRYKGQIETWKIERVGEVNP
jgi:hypothetical protein